MPFEQAHQHCSQRYFMGCSGFYSGVYVLSHFVDNALFGLLRFGVPGLGWRKEFSRPNASEARMLFELIVVSTVTLGQVADFCLLVPWS